MMTRPLLPALTVLLTLLTACVQDEADDATATQGEVGVQDGDRAKGGVEGKGDASALATFVDVKFKGTVYTDTRFRLESKIEDQMLYTIGQLNGQNSVGRLDKLTLSEVSATREGQEYRVDYTASLLVAWGKPVVPKSVELTLPRSVTSSALDAFATAYGHDCVDFGAHDVDAGSMWYYFRPNRSRCDFEQSDVFKVDAALSVSTVNTTGKFPEYHKVWEDGQMRVVAIFGKYEDGATSNRDAGISAYNDFVGTMRRTYGPNNLTLTPPSIPSAPGVQADDITFSVTLDGGKTLEVVALLVDNVRTAPRAFTSRYETLSQRADLIVYNGHAGLGANIRALADKGRWEKDQYSIVFMNGCDTYAYIDNALFDARARTNPGDPKGTKHLDIVTNAMPSFFSNMTASTMALIKNLSDIENPKTYEQIFRQISSTQVVLVSGEEDNEFVPGFGQDDPDDKPWPGLTASRSTLGKDEIVRFDTGVLKAGTYTFTMTGLGDADLYVRIGQAPDQKAWDCRPYRAGSSEQCTVEISSPTALHVMVHGWARASSFTLQGNGPL